MDLTEWDENGSGGGGGHIASTPHRQRGEPRGPAGHERSVGSGGGQPDLYAYRNGNSSRDEIEEHNDRRRAEIKRAENRFSDSASVISNTVLNHLHSIHRRPVNRVSLHL